MCAPRPAMFLVVCSLVGLLVGCGGGTTPTSPSAPPPSSSSSSTPAAEEGAEAATEATADIGEGWGHLKGRFVYGGSPPTPGPVQITKDQQFCGKFQVVDESVMANKETGGLANVVVYLYLGRGDKAPEAHESYAENADAQVVLDNNQCRFEPRVCLLQTTQTLLIKNSDEVGHNTKIDTQDNPSFNQTIPVGSALEQQFSAVERRPTNVSCSIHPWMKASLLIRDNPYFAVSDENGDFEIRNLPSGKWTFQVWHEKADSVTDVTIDGKATTWSRGRVELTITPDATNDVGEITLSPSLFEG